MEPHPSDDHASRRWWHRAELPSALKRLARQNSGTAAHFRSRTVRDIETDRKRLQGLQQHVDHLVEQIDSEHAGLTRRLQEATSRASVIGGTENGSAYEREAREERDFLEAEGQMTNAMKRLQQLEAQKLMLKRVAGVLEQTPAQAFATCP